MWELVREGRRVLQRRRSVTYNDWSRWRLNELARVGWRGVHGRELVKGNDEGLGRVIGKRNW